MIPYRVGEQVDKFIKFAVAVIPVMSLRGKNTGRVEIASSGRVVRCK
jgi:hypothetical protein